MRAAAVSVAAAGLLVLAGMTGCTAESAPPPCEGGDVRLLQQIPSDLPGGGSADFTEADVDADPPTVHLLIGGDSDAPYRLVVGDTFSVDGAEYEVACISASVVTLDAD